MRVAPSVMLRVVIFGAEPAFQKDIGWINISQGPTAGCVVNSNEPSDCIKVEGMYDQPRGCLFRKKVSVLRD
jgi:hypothetical protein